MNKLANMGRNERRAQHKYADTFPANLTAMPERDWPREREHGAERVAVYLSKHFLVQVYSERNDVVRLSINRSKIGPDNRWIDGITWDELQLIKRLIGYGERQAIEIYPEDSNIVNVANIRHLWLLPEPLSIEWRKA